MTSDSSTKKRSPLITDTISGVVVFLVALPLCLGIALASGADPISGLISGIIGGIVVGSISGSRTSVSGPAAGLTAIVAAQIATLGSFENFLFAVMVAGALQIVLGILRAGALVAFVPTSVINGLLAAIGVILILKQIPHLLGHDTDPEGEMSFSQPDHENTFSEFLTIFESDIQIGAITVGIISIIILVGWQKIKPLKNSFFPSQLAVVLLAVGMNQVFQAMNLSWTIEASHLVEVPISGGGSGFQTLMNFPDFTQWLNPMAYLAAATIAIVASLETLLNLEAVDKLDKQRRESPPNRELIAQGCGNMVCGLIGGLPVTSVIVRGSVNVDVGAKTQLSAIFHGALLLLAVAFLPVYLNMIPLSALAAILIVTGFKLASPKLFRQMWRDGWSQFLPFLITLVAIVLTDLLIGILIGLVVSAMFILYSNLRRTIPCIVENHLGSDITHIELPNQVSFLNRASLQNTLATIPNGAHVLIDATETDFIDPDIRALIREFRDTTAPARGLTVSLRGFTEHFDIQDQVHYAEYTTPEVRDKMTPQQVLNVLQDGNERFRSGNRLSRDFGRQLSGAAKGQSPLAVVLSCIDSRVPVELVFDMGLGDMFSVRVAGNVIGTKSLGSIEYGVAVAGAKLVLVLGHTRCGAVTESIRLLGSKQDALEATGCEHIGTIVDEIHACLNKRDGSTVRLTDDSVTNDNLVTLVTKRNVMHTVKSITARSTAVRKAVDEGRVLVVGALYDVATGGITILSEEDDPAPEA